MTQRNDKRRSKSLKLAFQELPYFNFPTYHGQFNNSCYTSVSDLDIFNLNTRQDEALNLHNDLPDQCIQID